MSTSQPTPTFVSSGDGMLITHREYVGDISGSQQFQTAYNLNLNPADPSTFPWLSKLATNFEQYEFLGLLFEYRPTSGMVGSTSPALGSISICTQYDWYEPAFQSKSQMDSYEFSTDVIPCSGAFHPVECAPKQTVSAIKYIANGSMSGDSRLYQMGYTQVSTAGMQSSYVCGQLWVTYHVRLLKPRISPSVSYAPTLNLYFQPTAAFVFSGLLNDARNFDSLSAGGNLVYPRPDALTSANSKIVLPNPGTYNVNLQIWLPRNAGNNDATIFVGSEGLNVFSPYSLANVTNTRPRPDTIIQDYQPIQCCFDVVIKLAGIGSDNTINLSMSGIGTMTGAFGNLRIMKLTDSTLTADPNVPPVSASSTANNMANAWST
jgi:hypothetical protein